MRLKKLSLPLGLLCGIVAAVLVFVYLQDQERRIAGPPPPKVPVLVARSDVPSGAKLGPEMVAAEQVLAETRHPQALQSLADVDGKLTLAPLVKGEQILASRLGDRPKAMTLAGVVPAGRRAVSLAANDVAGIAGLVQPGDWVDVLAVFEDRDGAKTGGIAVLALENIQVLAVSKEVNGVDAPKDAASQAAADAKKANVTTSPTTPYFTVTLAVTPEEAQRLMIADRSGNIRLALRARGDVARQLGCESHCAHFSPSVDWRPAAIAALRHGRTKEKISAAGCARRDFCVRAYGMERWLRPCEYEFARRSDRRRFGVHSQRRKALVHKLN